jgi:hypothetical protein
MAGCRVTALYLGKWASKTIHRQPPTPRVGSGRAGPGRQTAPTCRLVLFWRATNTALHLASTSRPRYTCHTKHSTTATRRQAQTTMCIYTFVAGVGQLRLQTCMLKNIEFLGRKLLTGRENCIICGLIFIRNHHEGTNLYAQYDCKWEVEL